MKMIEDYKIKVGDYVIVQRQDFTKLYKVKQHSTMMLGKFNVEMDNIVEHRFCDTFHIINHPKNKKLHTLEKVTESCPMNTEVNIQQSGKDNRNIMADGNIQALTKDDIEKFTENESKSNKIVEHLISNSKTFNMKTKYSQAKYIKKKEKKYFNYIEIRKPTVRLLANMYYRQDPEKILHLRVDDLSQILMYANIHAEGNHLLLDTGTRGLLTAAVMNAIGANTSGRLIYMHPGNECQKTALVAMGYPQEQKDRCVNVNIYSVLRYFYQKKDEYSEKIERSKNAAENQEGPPNKKDNLTEDIPEINEPPAKKLKLDENSEKIEPTLNIPVEGDEPSKEVNQNSSVSENPAKELKKPQWHYDNLKVCKILENLCDSLIIVTKQHPLSSVKELVRFLKPGRQLVVFHVFKEPLIEIYNYLKSRLDFIMIRISDNFMRNYQVLPDRTHPEVLMTTGGFVLSAVKISN